MLCQEHLEICCIGKLLMAINVLESLKVRNGTLTVVAPNRYLILPHAHCKGPFFFLNLRCVLFGSKISSENIILYPGFQNLCGKSVLGTGWETRETGPFPGTATGALRSPCGSATTWRRWGTTQPRTQIHICCALIDYLMLLMCFRSEHRSCCLSVSGLNTKSLTLWWGSSSLPPCRLMNQSQLSTRGRNWKCELSITLTAIYCINDFVCLEGRWTINPLIHLFCSLLFLYFLLFPLP